MAIHWTHKHFDTLTSTQDYAKEAAANGAAEGTIVVTDGQEQGRGRRGRSWVMGKGDLAASFILRPDCNATDLGQVSILIGVALAQTAASFDKTVALKWPNDMLLKTPDGYKKCAGTLLDSDLASQGMVEWLVVGVGVNLQTAPEYGVALGLGRDAFLAGFLQNVADLYESWNVSGFESIRQSWLKMCVHYDVPLKSGQFEDLDSGGNLIVRDDQNMLKTVSAGDVYLKDTDHALCD